MLSDSFTSLRQVSFSTISPIIFRDAATAPLGTKLMSLFPGLGYAAGYKVAQRIYKFGGQPWFNDLITRHYKSNFTNTFGERKGKMMTQACAGRCAVLVITYMHMYILISTQFDRHWRSCAY
jgi:hypothetical protein